ncbi:MAG: 3-hydroxyisobutyrate dehydrogenase [Rhizobium sp.]|nr:3-hydroxyisobutyrate dehydrogenase [Rhizobium sp.]MBX9459581.1 3-hydroxyisobutyrate dehydrogenase [Rhizobium sp.]
MKIGFFGLGNMGGPMASNLARAGHELTGYDPVGTTAEGVVAAQSATEAVAGQDVVITMLPNGKILRDVYDEIVGHGAQGALFVDCSTVDVDSALHAHARARAAGIDSLDAPVSGGISGAAAGTLTFMVGGDATAYARAVPLFDIMGQKAVHCGADGTGQAAKICNNMILGISMIGVCEAFALADRLGLDRQKMFDVASTSSGSCWALNSYCPAPGVGPKSPADNGYNPGFAAELMLKDLMLSQAAAEVVNAPTPLGAAAAAFYQAFVDHGGRGRDFSAVLPRLTEMKRGEEP